MNVPLLDLTRQYQSLKSELEPVLLEVAASQQFIMGPAIGKFESECVKYCCTKYSLGVSSGTDALLLALMALGIGQNDEVITVPYSFFATAGSIARVGAKPVFVDIEPEGFNIDVTRIEQAITKRTKAIMPVHLFGQCAEMTPLLEIAGRHGIPVIEDAAQAIGSEYEGKRAGEFGAVGCFSFFPSKNLGAFGDAGLVTCQDDELYEKLKMLRVHGSKVKYFHEAVGANFRLDTLQAAVLSVKLKYLDGWTAKRQENAELYRSLFKDRNIGPDRIVLPTSLPHRRHIYNQFVVRVQNRDEVLKSLKEKGVGTEVYYPLPLHLQKCFESLGYRKEDFPESERAANETLALPIFPELTTEEIEYVVGTLSAVV